MTKQNAKIKPSLALAHEQRRIIGEQTRDELYAVLASADQPLIAREVAHLFSQKTGRYFDQTYVRTMLLEFVADGIASTRQETPDEMMIRNDGVIIRGTHGATYFWAPAGKVPFRTKATVAPVTGTRKKTKKKTARKAAPARQAAPKTQTGSSTSSLETMLMKRIVELEEQLEAVRSLLK